MSVTFFGFNANGNRGVAAGLGNIQKVRDGERLSGRVNASAEFEEITEADDGAEAFDGEVPEYLK